METYGWLLQEAPLTSQHLLSASSVISAAQNHPKETQKSQHVVVVKNQQLLGLWRANSDVQDE